jgi:hypothetical protein
VSGFAFRWLEAFHCWGRDLNLRKHGTSHLYQETLLLRRVLRVVVMVCLGFGAISWSAGPAGGAGGGRIFFRVQVSKRGMQTDALAEGKTLTDFSQEILPGRLYAPPIKVGPVARASAKWDTPVAVAAADFSAQKADDADWILENFAPGDRSEVQSSLHDKTMRSRNRAFACSR